MRPFVAACRDEVWGRRARAMAADPSLLGPWLAGVTSFAGDDGHAAVRDGLGL